MRRSEYLLDVATSLAACQMLELELKLYLERAFEVIRKKTKGVVPFRFDGADYDDASLERLISTFRKINENQGLIERLERFRKDRNFVAHKAITDCLDPHEGGFIDSQVAEVQKLLERVSIEARQLTDLVSAESNQFLGHYYFDDGKA